jgi:hypothetical protein
MTTQKRPLFSKAHHRSFKTIWLNILWVVTPCSLRDAGGTWPLTLCCLWRVWPAQCRWQDVRHARAQCASLTGTIRDIAARGRAGEEPRVQGLLWATNSYAPELRQNTAPYVGCLSLAANFAALWYTRRLLGKDTWDSGTVYRYRLSRWLVRMPEVARRTPILRIRSITCGPVYSVYYSYTRMYCWTHTRSLTTRPIYEQLVTPMG